MRPHSWLIGGNGLSMRVWGCLRRATVRRDGYLACNAGVEWHERTASGTVTSVTSFLHLLTLVRQVSMYRFNI